MPIYKQTTEITNIDDIWAGVDKDIVEIYFGDKNVFTVWGEYEGTLPATLNANGANMRQYQIYGNTGGVGDKTVNLFDESKAGMIQFRPTTGELRYGINFGILPAGVYTIKFNRIGSQNLILTFLYSNNYSDENITNKSLYTFTTQGNAEIIIRTQANVPTTFSNMGFTNIMLTEGSTAPETFVPFGYEVDMRVRSLNIYNTAETSWSADGTILNDSGEPISSGGSHYTTNFIPVEPGEVYYLAGSLANETRWRVYFYDSNKNWIRRTGSKSPDSTRLIAMDENASYFQLQVGIDISSTSDWNFIHSRTAPEKYQPYFNTVTPIYIGDDPLDKDEYINYQAGKIYRMINGVLTPTDSPVPLPALPTCEGMTIVDYAGSGTAPSSVEIKYKKGW